MRIAAIMTISVFTVLLMAIPGVLANGIPNPTFVTGDVDGDSTTAISIGWSTDIAQTGSHSVHVTTSSVSTRDYAVVGVPTDFELNSSTTMSYYGYTVSGSGVNAPDEIFLMLDTNNDGNTDVVLGRTSPPGSVGSWVQWTLSGSTNWYRVNSDGSVTPVIISAYYGNKVVSVALGAGSPMSAGVTVDVYFDNLIVNGNTLLDDDTGTIEVRCGTIVGYLVCTSIQDGIDAALPGDTVNVAAGLYTEAVTINKELTLLGATSTECKKDFVLPIALGDYDASTQSVIKAPAPYGGSYAQDNPNTVTITSSNVVLKGFVIEALDRDYHRGNDYNNLVELRPTANTMTGITIENNVIGPNMGQETPRVNGRHGVRLTASGKTISAQITCNKIHGTHGNGNNVFIWGTALGTTPTLPAADLSGTVIENNDICYSARSGIEFSGAQFGATIDNNCIHDNGAGYIGDDTDLKWGNGIMFVRDYVDVVHGNGNDPGLGASAGYVDGVTITDNEIYNNDKNGIYMGPMNKNHAITGNDIHDNGNSARDSSSTFGPGDGIRIDLDGWYYSGSWFGGPYANALYGSTSNIVANFNNIEDNVGYGAQVVGIPTNNFVLDAKYNWWGDVSGPYDPLDTDGLNQYNPGGLGDPVTEYVLYEPWIGRCGMVTGGGWIISPAGAYTSDTSLSEKATFGFVSMYKKGATVPTGQTQFQFKVADLNFHSDSYDWLVVAGEKAMYKGTGTINGAGDYGFMLSAIDGDIDMFRIKIRDKGTDTVIYDNHVDSPDGTVVAGGQIVIHKTKAK